MVNEIPFDLQRKRRRTVHAAPEGSVLYCKGAPEVVLARCTWAEMDGGGRRAFGRPGRHVPHRNGGHGRERFARSRLRLAQVAREFRAGERRAARWIALSNCDRVKSDDHPKRAAIAKRFRQRDRDEGSLYGLTFTANQWKTPPPNNHNKRTIKITSPTIPIPPRLPHRE
jgi:magnesium-transporting ATPase (P-type)